ncbi:hypothetical protein Vafri_15035, partial [Volvox africanus]
LSFRIALCSITVDSSPTGDPRVSDANCCPYISSTSSASKPPRPRDLACRSRMIREARIAMLLRKGGTTWMTETHQIMPLIVLILIYTVHHNMKVHGESSRLNIPVFFCL